MRDKVVLITGGAGGIGQAAAKLFLNEGAKVVLVDINESSLAKAKESLTDNPENVGIIQADVTKEEDVKKYVQKRLINLAASMFSLIMQELMVLLRKLLIWIRIPLNRLCRLMLPGCF